MKLLIVCLVASLLGVTLAATIPEYTPVVKTKQGSLRGIVREFEDEKVHVYEGVRYGTVHITRFNIHLLKRTIFVCPLRSCEAFLQADHG